MERKTEDNPVLYILMRDDMDSLNPGKACAQATHAGQQFVHELTKQGIHPPHDQVIKLEQYERWKAATRKGFGTTVTKSVNHKQLHQIVLFALAAGFEAGVVHDPTYPLLDGETVHVIPVDTCGYVFGDKESLEILLRQFELHP